MGRRLAGIIVVAVAAGAALLPIPSAWVERHYARAWFPVLQRFVTAASNAAPFALLDVVVVVGAACAAIGLVSVARARRGEHLRCLARLTWQAVVAAALAYLAFLAMWGLNYRRPPISAGLDFDEGRVTADAVVALNETAIGELIRLRPRVPGRVEEWPDRRQLANGLGPALDVATRLLGLPGPVRAGRPKTSLLDPYFTRAGVTGMTDPFFLETVLASNLLPFEEPAVIAHEWGHLAGLARESDASFFGLLACLHGADEARYSGWLDIFLYTLGARDADGRRGARARLPVLVRDDLAAMAERSARDQVRIVSLAAWRTYDSYLRSNRVSSGVRNYGEVVRLLVGTRFEAGWKPVRR